MPIARTFTLPNSVINFIDKLPSKEKSKYVAQVLLKDIEEQTKKEALEALYNIKRVKDDDPRSSVELVKEARKKRQAVLNNETQQYDK